MSTKRIILISGYARSGKDSLANALKRELEIYKREARILKFANALKEALQAALNRVGLGHIDVFTEDDEMKKFLRPLLVEFGKFARKMDKDVFVKALIKDMEALFCGGVEVALISDCRYLNEAMLLRAWAKDTGSLITRLHIYRDGLDAANSEERYSIQDLNLFDRDFRERTFLEGDVDGIASWSKEIVEADEIVKADRPRIHGMDAPDLHALRYGVTARVSEHLTGKIVVQDNELLEQVLNIKLTLERMEARLRRLEINK